MASVLLQGDIASPGSVEPVWEVAKVLAPIVAGALSGWALALWQLNTKRHEQTAQMNQERKALLLLVKSEMIANTERIRQRRWITENLEEYHRSLEADPHSDTFGWKQEVEKISKGLGRSAERHITTATWDSTKVRLAQLLQAAEVNVLIIYYDELISLLPYLPHVDFHDKNEVRSLLSQLERMLEFSESALEDLERIQDKY